MYLWCCTFWETGLMKSCFFFPLSVSKKLFSNCKVTLKVISQPQYMRKVASALPMWTGSMYYFIWWKFFTGQKILRKVLHWRTPTRLIQIDLASFWLTKFIWEKSKSVLPKKILFACYFLVAMGVLTTVVRVIFIFFSF